MVQWNLDGMTKSFKVYCMCCVALPKLLIAVILSLIGGMYIKLTSSVENLVLNTLAVNFVVDIDEFLYQAFTSDATKGNLDNMKTLQVDVDNNTRFWLWVTTTCIHPLLTFGV